MIKFKKTLKNIAPYEIDSYYTNYELKLDSNENIFGPSPKVLSAISNLSKERIQFYPAYGRLLDILSGEFHLDKKNFVLTNGCDEAINVVFSAFLGKGDKVLSYAPTFSMPKLYANLQEAVFEEVTYPDNFEFDYELFLSKIQDDVKILYFTTPNNPTGGVVLPEYIRNFAELYKDKLIVVDCTYINYSNLLFKNYVDVLKSNNNVVLLRSFSKDHALAGLRLGYIIGNSDILNEVKKVISPYSVNSVAVEAGIAALSDKEHFLKVKSEILKSKEYLTKELVSMGYKPFGSQTNFLLCDFGEHSEFLYQKLLNNGIKVKRFKTPDRLKNVFRITIPPFEDSVKLIQILKKRPLFVFDLDGVVFDVKNSYRLAIKKTCEYFTGKIVADCDIQRIKNQGNMSNDWDVTYSLIKESDVCVDYQKMVDVFQELFFKKDNVSDKGFIDNETNVIGADFFKELTKYADCAVFTGRPKEEAFYSLNKFGILKYISYAVCNEDVEGNFKPSPYGLNKIKSCCPNSEIFYFGDTVDDVKAGVDALVKVFGVIPPNAPSVEETKEKLMEFGAAGVVENCQNILNLLDKENLLCKK